MNKKIFLRINQLLLQNWDPLGVKDIPGANDEYSSYVPEINQIIQNASAPTPLFEFLWELETQYMGLKGDRIKTEEFSRVLFNDIKQNPEI